MRNKVVIYKQDAIDAVADGLKRVFVENRDVAEILLKNVPSAQPEIIRCKDCRHNHDCNIQYHAQAGEEFYCGVAERRTNEQDD